tara:strand:- start:74 stop:511 length:438 start_codon:yes stop_codon:yes gene_type:complete
MDSKTAVEIREKVEAFVQDLANEYGLSPQVGRVTYNNDFARMKVEFEEMTEAEVEVQVKDFVTGKVLNTYTHTVPSVPKSFINDGAKFGIKASDYNRVFTALDGNEYQVVGVNKRARKRPVIIKRLSDGKEFASTLRHALIASNR